MKRDEILRMKQDAELWAEQELQCIGEYHPDFHDVADVRFAFLVEAAEREECAREVEDQSFRQCADVTEARSQCAAAIRARRDAA